MYSKKQKNGVYTRLAQLCMLLVGMCLLTPPGAQAQQRSSQQDFDVMSCVRAAQESARMLECGDEYIVHWADRMHLSYRQLNGLLPEARRIMLEDAQDMWNEFRVQHVNLSNTIHFGSEDQMYQVLAKIREARIYQQRSEYLEDLIEVQQSSRQLERH